MKRKKTEQQTGDPLRENALLRARITKGKMNKRVVEWKTTLSRRALRASNVAYNNNFSALHSFATGSKVHHQKSDAKKM